MAPAARTSLHFGLQSCLPTASVLPVPMNEKFGTFSFYGQLLGKQSGLLVLGMYSV
jgi:hypothetical protein